MRRLMVQVPHPKGEQVVEAAQDLDAVNVTSMRVDSPEGLADLVILHLSNDRIGELIDALEGPFPVRVSFDPDPVIVLHPPPSEAPQQVTNVAPRSAFEIYLQGLQSVGSWKGFLGYTVAAGVVVWIGLFTNTSYLLIAAMLIAPFAGPAMNVALASARGDWQLLRQNLQRYFVALGAIIVTTLGLSILLQQETATALMVSVSHVSSVSVLLPLVTGAAGALNLAQSERSSLVSGTAVGLLVAASLAPPAGLIGMALALREWQMVLSSTFVLLLQLVAINLTGSLVFRMYGLSPQGPRYPSGKGSVQRVALVLTLVALLVMLGIQFANSPDLQRSSREQRAVGDIQAVVEESNLASLVEAQVRFPRADVQGQDTLLTIVYVQRQSAEPLSDEQVHDQIKQAIEARLMQKNPSVTPLVSVTVLDAPPGAPWGE